MADDHDPDELVSVQVEGRDGEPCTLNFWQAVDVSRGLDRGAASFSVGVGRGKMREKGFSGLPVGRFDRVQVLIGEDLVITGAVDKVKRARGAENHGVSLHGRSVTSDLIDCSAINAPGQWSKASLLRIAEDLARGPGPGRDRMFNIPVIADPVASSIVPNFEIEQGESPFEGIERLGRMRGLVVHDGPTGALHLVRPGTRRAEVTLRHLDGPDGEPDPDNNVIESDFTDDASKLFSDIIVKGQSEGGAAKAGAKGQARDHSVPRFRPLIVPPEGQASTADCLKRAQWEVARRAGKALQLTHTVKGWRQTRGGPLWDIGLVVPVEDDNAELYRDMLIVEVKWKLDKGGRLAVLTLEPPEAWEPQPFVDKHGTGDKWASVRKQVNGQG